MTKKRASTKRRRVKKQIKQKSRKIQKYIKGGNRAILSLITNCIQQTFPTASNYINNDDDWTKLALLIDRQTTQGENMPRVTVISCNDSRILLYTDNILIDNGFPRGNFYASINGSIPILLWKNGRQQTYLPGNVQSNTQHLRTNAFRTQ
jgi:hypothetical protein